MEKETGSSHQENWNKESGRVKNSREDLWTSQHLEYERKEREKWGDAGNSKTKAVWEKGVSMSKREDLLKLREIVETMSLDTLKQLNSFLLGGHFICLELSG